MRVQTCGETSDRRPCYRNDDETLKRRRQYKKIADAVCKYHEQEREKGLKVKLLEREKAEAEKASKNIIKAIEQGIITDMTKERLRELETTIKRLENEINEEKCKNYSYLTREEVEAYLETVVVNDPDTLELRKAITNTFIREIVVYKDKLIITYNFTNNKEPIRVNREGTEDIEERSKSASLFILKLRSPICIAREPNPYNPNLIFAKDWFGLFVCFDLFMRFYMR